MTTHATEAKLDAFENRDWAGVLDIVPGPEGVLPCAEPSTCGACAIYAPALPGEGRVEHGRRLVERVQMAGDVVRRWERKR